ncbi:MAG: hypothetical protein ACRDY7_12875 [Acidimicrobiia bacterium]
MRTGQDLTTVGGVAEATSHHDGRSVEVAFILDGLAHIDTRLSR